MIASRATPQPNTGRAPNSQEAFQMLWPRLGGNLLAHAPLLDCRPANSSRGEFVPNRRPIQSKRVDLPITHSPRGEFELAQGSDSAGGPARNAIY